MYAYATFRANGSWEVAVNHNLEATYWGCAASRDYSGARRKALTNVRQITARNMAIAAVYPIPKKWRPALAPKNWRTMWHVDSHHTWRNNETGAYCGETIFIDEVGNRVCRFVEVGDGWVISNVTYCN